MKREVLQVRRLTGCVILAVLGAVAIGCNTTLIGGYWQPAIESTQTSGVGGGAVDVASGLGVKPDEDWALYYELIGEEGARAGQRLRLSYMRAIGTGSVTNTSGSDFTFGAVVAEGTDTDQLESSMQVETISIFWEPSFVSTSNLRLRLVLGASMLQTRLNVRNVTDTEAQLAAVPDSTSSLVDLGLDYVPVPLWGAMAEVGLNTNIKLHVRWLVFDAKSMRPDENFIGTVTNWEAGVLFGGLSGLRGFLGYRNFNASYTYDGAGGQDECDTTVSGMGAAVDLRF